MTSAWAYGRRLWMRGWMKLAGTGRIGRLPMRIAAWAAPPHRGRTVLARFSRAGFISPSATTYHRAVSFGAHVFIGDRVVLFSRDHTGRISIGDSVYVHQDTFIETGEGGEVVIEAGASVHPRCQLMAYKGSIRIGAGAQLAYGCGLYPYDHGIALGQTIRSQPLTTKGDIEIGSDAWLGTGVVVTSGVRIGSGAVIAAGSTVMHDVPDNAIAAGVPARVIAARTAARAVNLVPDKRPTRAVAR
jgi:acetyltransferase-like isoleucine patch superfamily enzyme